VVGFHNFSRFSYKHATSHINHYKRILRTSPTLDPSVEQPRIYTMAVPRSDSAHVESRLTSGFLVHGDPAEFSPGKWQTGTLPQRHLETHLDVLIVGAGLAGLMTALECWRKGHNIVGILERSEGPMYAGKLPQRAWRQERGRAESCCRRYHHHQPVGRVDTGRI
jgi:hypothetical protein